jgi:hypothetical protein
MEFLSFCLTVSNDGCSSAQFGSRGLRGSVAKNLRHPVAFGPELLETFKIGLKEGMASHAVLKALELEVQRPRSLGRQGVDHPLPAPLGLDQAMIAQVGQVLRDGNLGKVEDFLEMADTEGPASEQVQDSESGFIAETLVDAEQVHICNERNMRACEYSVKRSPRRCGMRGVQLPARRRGRRWKRSPASAPRDSSNPTSLPSPLDLVERSRGGK